MVSEAIQTYDVGIVWYRFWYRSKPIIASHRRKKMENEQKQNGMSN